MTLQILSFESKQQFERWLKSNYSSAEGIWVRFLKKAHKESSGAKSISYAEALDASLCWGWIDSLVKKYDAASYIQKFTPRGKRSVWSKRNREHVARLIKQKRMKAPGLAQVMAAKKDGRWAQAYDSPKTMKLPKDFLRLLKTDKAALEFFKTLSKSNLFAIGYRLQTAVKAETKKRRMFAILEMLRRQQKFH
ncbi:MAG: hypothetical protein RIQ56_103 [Candidatus Parcubacteria bacterium]|jgi:uncharacterized protein YdeI (YjbR/CyaY-like superfamily)